MNLAPKTDRGRASRQRLEHAALTVFVERGIDGATTKEIAQRAGMAEGNLYRHYPSKEDLAFAVFSSHLSLVVAALDAERVAGGDTRAILGRLLHRFRELFEGDPDVYAFIVIAHHSLTARTPREVRTPTDVVADVLLAGQRRGEIASGDTLLLASMVVGVVARVAYLKLEGLLYLDLDALERETEAAVWRLVSAPPSVV